MSEDLAARPQDRAAQMDRQPARAPFALKKEAGDLENRVSELEKRPIGWGNRLSRSRNRSVSKKNGSANRKSGSASQKTGRRTEKTGRRAEKAGRRAAQALDRVPRTPSELRNPAVTAPVTQDDPLIRSPRHRAANARAQAVPGSAMTRRFVLCISDGGAKGSLGKRDEFGSDDDALAWEAEDWAEFDAPR